MHEFRLRLVIPVFCDGAQRPQSWGCRRLGVLELYGVRDGLLTGLLYSYMYWSQLDLIGGREVVQ